MDKEASTDNPQNAAATSETHANRANLDFSPLCDDYNNIKKQQDTGRGKISIPDANRVLIDANRMLITWRCYWCAHKHYWVNAGGERVCWRCHPQAAGVPDYPDTPTPPTVELTAWDMFRARARHEHGAPGYTAEPDEHRQGEMFDGSTILGAYNAMP